MSTWRTTNTEADAAQFTDEFKAGAVRLVLDEGKTVAAAARDLGLTESALQLGRAGPGGPDEGKTGLTTEEREELARCAKKSRASRRSATS